LSRRGAGNTNHHRCGKKRERYGRTERHASTSVGKCQRYAYERPVSRKHAARDFYSHCQKVVTNKN
jgi:hypothetical protein